MSTKIPFNAVIGPERVGLDLVRERNVVPKKGRSGGESQSSRGVSAARLSQKTGSTNAFGGYVKVSNSDGTFRMRMVAGNARTPRATGGGGGGLSGAPRGLLGGASSLTGAEGGPRTTGMDAAIAAAFHRYDPVHKEERIAKSALNSAYYVLFALESGLKSDRSWFELFSCDPAVPMSRDLVDSILKLGRSSRALQLKAVKKLDETRFMAANIRPEHLVPLVNRCREFVRDCEVALEAWDERVPELLMEFAEGSPEWIQTKEMSETCTESAMRYIKRGEDLLAELEAGLVDEDEDTIWSVRADHGDYLVLWNGVDGPGGVEWSISKAELLAALEGV